MMSTLVFNGQNAKKFGLTVERLPEAVHPERRGYAYQIAGRNGKRRRENGTFENYDQPYEVWFRDFSTKRDVYQITDDIAAWLLGSSGYCRLEDTYEPDVFRMACFAGPLNCKAALRHYGRATLVFDCQPERYLRTGEKAVTLFENVDLSSTISRNKSIVNPYVVSARPLIRLTGRGQIRLMSEGPDPHTPMTDITIQLESEDVTIEIDCDSYAVQTPSRITYHTTYPVLPSLFPGTNLFALTNVGVSDPGYVTKLEIIPRWWKP